MRATKNQIPCKRNNIAIPKTANDIAIERLLSENGINQLLAENDVSKILADLNEKKPTITDMIVIYMGEHGLKWQTTENTLESLALWMLENMKADLLEDEE